MTGYITASPPARSGEPVLIPGDPERANRAQRLARGRADRRRDLARDHASPRAASMCWSRRRRNPRKIAPHSALVREVPMKPAAMFAAAFGLALALARRSP